MHVLEFKSVIDQVKEVQQGTNVQYSGKLFAAFIVPVRFSYMLVL